MEARKVILVICSSLLLLTSAARGESIISIGVDGGYSNVVVKISNNLRQEDCGATISNLKVTCPYRALVARFL